MTLTATVPFDADTLSARVHCATFQPIPGGHTYTVGPFDSYMDAHAWVQEVNAQLVRPAADTDYFDPLTPSDRRLFVRSLAGPENWTR